MATKAQESIIRKEKKVTSSISNTRQPRNSTSKQVTLGFTAKDKPNPTAKPTPNYLRPTLSSRPDSLVKPLFQKIGNEDAMKAQNAQILRRRSFDGPPSASRTQQLFASLDSKRPSSLDKTSTRSSSFSSTRIPSPKPALERNSKYFKPVKSQPPPPATRTVTRNSCFSKNNERSRCTSGKNEILVPKTNIQERNEEITSIPDTKIMATVESEAQSALSETEEENHNISEEQSQSVFREIEIKETEVQCDENQLKVEENQMNIEESSKIVDDQEARIVIEDDHIKQEENVSENVDDSTVQGEIQTRTEEEHKPKEEQNVVEEKAEAKPGVAKSSVPPLQRGQGRKEYPAAYNDVIEETKKKLMEKRKNKVKALVGAFETVINFETAASR